MGAWFEAQVVKVLEEVAPTSGDDAPSSSILSERNVFYHVKFDERVSSVMSIAPKIPFVQISSICRYSDDEISKLTAADVRLRATYRIDAVGPGLFTVRP